MCTVCTGDGGGGGKNLHRVQIICPTSKVGANLHRVKILKTPFTSPKYTWVQIAHTDTAYFHEYSQSMFQAEREGVLFYVLSSCSCAQFVPGEGKFAHRVQIWSCERCFKNLHPSANCAHERKPYIFIHFDWRFR